ERRAIALAHALRRAGLGIDLAYRGNLKKRMQRANKVHARLALILGDDELARDIVALRDLDTGEQTELPIDSVSESLLARR
ncbi:MAG: His/Gly/Thr/Pro-type tRNA ligase C-terminal domain-containing protein, partial [Proteobacteria bacterium]|nr:His/Gly/Thr/Pro-type tRNA ligase C-terminal domain-containing protein [Pseudomonadota bacterium]